LSFLGGLCGLLFPPQQTKLFEKIIQREEFEQKGTKTTKKSCFAKATKDRDVAAFSFWEYPKPRIP